MRKSYYVMHKLLRYAQVITLCEKCITVCGNYYIMRKLLRYAASQALARVCVRARVCACITRSRE